jgi:hypothetical protein
MSLNPSNRISEQVTGLTPFPNVAGMGRHDPQGVDGILKRELKAAGIKPVVMECMRNDNEPHSAVLGEMQGWLFKRAWYYWVAKGRGIPVEEAEALHATHGNSVRVDGHCGCPSPLEWCKGFPVTVYHIDNQQGLNALADTIRGIIERGQKMLAERGAK